MSEQDKPESATPPPAPASEGDAMPKGDASPPEDPKALPPVD
jgi:hypothetical protein